VRVLIADDESTSRLLLKAMVSKLGHQCLVAEDGSQAWEVLSGGGIDVLLTDWMMPGVDGPALCRRVREELIDAYVYIVLITSLENSEHVLEGMGAGADDYLTKPVDSFSVRTRLIAAERVTHLHGRLAVTQAELAKVNDELLERSLTDPLTALGNRRRMEEDLARTHARALRTERSYGVALMDVDHFKLFNDHYGHVAGDTALRDIASAMDLVTRAGECVYRYGGEEFLLLIPDSDSATMIFTASERLRRAVADLGIPHEARPAEPALITLSGGVSTWLAGSKATAAEVVGQADEALYRAKSAGRNRIQVSRAVALQAASGAVVAGT
jgi:two-component system, cell cycle response regulator